MRIINFKNDNVKEKYDNFIKYNPIVSKVLKTTYNNDDPLLICDISFGDGKINIECVLSNQEYLLSIYSNQEICYFDIKSVEQKTSHLKGNKSLLSVGKIFAKNENIIYEQRTYHLTNGLYLKKYYLMNKDNQYSILIENYNEINIDLINYLLNINNSVTINDLLDIICRLIDLDSIMIKIINLQNNSFINIQYGLIKEYKEYFDMDEVRSLHNGHLEKEMIKK